MSRLILAGLLAMTCSVGHTDAAPGERFAHWFEEGVAQRALIGAVVAEIDGDEVRYQTFGSVRADLEQPPEPSTRFEIGSITKVFTNLLLVEMVAAGAVGYDTNLASLLPDVDFANPQVGEITLEHLATHHSGLPRLPSNLRPDDPANPYAGYEEALLLEELAGARDGQTLTQAYAYSNLGVGLLGYLLGEVDGRGYETALRERVLAPLGIDAAGIGCGEEDAIGHSGQLPTAYWDIAILTGAGGLCASAVDLVTLLKAYLSGESNLRHDLDADLEISRDAGGAGLTKVWHVAHSEQGPVYWHGGGTGGFRSYAGFNPKTTQGLVVLSNSDTELTAMAMSHLGVVLGENEEMKAEEADHPLDAYVGHFELTPSFGLSFRRHGDTLLVQATGQPTLSMTQSREDRFNLNEVDAEIIFSRDGAGEVTEVVLNQNGQRMPGKRVAEPVKAKSFEVIDVAEETLADYAGRYQLVPGVAFTIRVSNGQLAAQLTGQPSVPVYPHAKDKFHYKVVDAQLTFHRSEDGTVEALTLHQNGIDQRARRVE